ncbi:HAD family phosphatase [Microbacterium immunditiarum]|uniref:HAD superfamily hydrolase (TIGR01509 family) n=1 Tax=Microbacterium immunditiarum TaxID=337480 RepID=A0A7Y9KK04_9MICO|nr:HAD superfamily hydrolase (TIGR01509 family) [Microbacterium immunditiarum]
MNPRLPAAVLWDMDGTLVDTEPYWIAAETPLVESFGGSWSHEESLRLVGLGLDDAARIFQDAGVRMPVDDIVNRLTDDVLAQLTTRGVPFRPGARELLASLRDAGVPTALVTMSLRRMAQSVVDLIDFEAFDIIVAGDEVARPKPFPDPYLRASELLGVDPADTIAIEDSPNGLRSAVAAGAVAIGVPNIIGLEGAGAHALWPTLSGRTADDIAALHGAHFRGVRR